MEGSIFAWASDLFSAASNGGDMNDGEEAVATVSNGAGAGLPRRASHCHRPVARQLSSISTVHRHQMLSLEDSVCSILEMLKLEICED